MKVLVSDFDGVFFTKDYDQNIKLVNDFVGKGNVFIITTERNITDLYKDIENHYIKCSYFICNNGAAIYDQFLNIIYRRDIHKKYVKPICNFLSSSKHITNTYIDTTTGLVSDSDRSANQILGHFLNEEIANVMANKINSSCPGVIAYLNKPWIHIQNKDATISNAIDFLCKYYNFDKYNIYTIGNDIYDISLADFEESYILYSAAAFLKKDFGHVISNFKEAINNINKS